MYKLELTERQTKLLEFVKQLHGAQLRKYTNEPYWTHPLAVAEIVSEFLIDSYAIEVALCHDLFEDTNCTKWYLNSFLLTNGYNTQEAFVIVNDVDGLTDKYTPELYPELNRFKRKQQEAVRLCGITERAQSVKYADLIHNSMSIIEHDPGFAKLYLPEKLQILNYMRNGDIRLFVKCCHSLYEGMNKLKIKL